MGAGRAAEPHWKGIETPVGTVRASSWICGRAGRRARVTQVVVALGLVGNGPTPMDGLKLGCSSLFRWAYSSVGFSLFLFFLLFFFFSVALLTLDRNTEPIYLFGCVWFSFLFFILRCSFHFVLQLSFANLLLPLHLIYFRTDKRNLGVDTWMKPQNLTVQTKR